MIHAQLPYITYTQSNMSVAVLNWMPAWSVFQYTNGRSAHISFPGPYGDETTIKRAVAAAKVSIRSTSSKGQRVLILNRLVNQPLPIQGSEIPFSWILCCNFSNDLDIHYGTNMFHCCNLPNLHIWCSFWRITQKLGLKSILADL